MKKHFLITLLLMAFAMAATAQNKKIAILETVDKEGNVPYGIRLQLRSNLTYAISNTPGYEGYDRVDMSQIIGEHDFQRTGMVSDEQIRQLGEMTGASSILVAEAAVYDKDNIIITAKILNVETASVERAVPPQISSTNPREMQKACEELANKLLGISIDSTEPTSDSNSLLNNIFNRKPKNTQSDAETDPVATIPSKQPSVVETPKKEAPKKPIVEEKELISWRKYYYYLGERRLTDDEYMRLINNCPEAYLKYEKGIKHIKTGKTFLLWIPIGCVATGAVIGAIAGVSYDDYLFIPEGAAVGAIFGGIPSALTSIPFFISGNIKKKNAYKEYNKYCAQPKATLSFGPTANGIGVCLSF